MPKFSITCTAFRPLRKGSLVGFATVHIEQLHLVITDIAIHESHGKRWVAMPARPWVKDDRVVRGEDGKVKYQPLFDFDHRPSREAFSDRVIEAVLRHDPHAFADTEAAA